MGVRGRTSPTPLTWRKYGYVLDEAADPPKLLIIGPDGAGNLLELIGGDLNDDRLIWHAMPCRAKYLELLPKPGGDL
jgi:hypothetical protein